MSNGFIPALVLVCLLVVFGAIIPFFISPFIDVSRPNNESSITGLISVITDGIELYIPLVGNVTLALPYISSNTYIQSYCNVLTYYPDYIIVPVSLILIVCLIFAIAGIVHG